MAKNTYAGLVSAQYISKTNDFLKLAENALTRGGDTVSNINNTSKYLFRAQQRTNTIDPATPEYAVLDRKINVLNAKLAEYANDSAKAIVDSALKDLKHGVEKKGAMTADNLRKIADSVDDKSKYVLKIFGAVSAGQKTPGVSEDYFLNQSARLDGVSAKLKDTIVQVDYAQKVDGYVARARTVLSKGGDPIRNMQNAYRYIKDAEKSARENKDPVVADLRKQKQQEIKYLKSALSDYASSTATRLAGNAGSSVNWVERGVGFEKHFLGEPGIPTKLMSLLIGRSIKSSSKRLDDTKKYLNRVKYESKKLGLGVDVTGNVDRGLSKLGKLRTQLEEQKGEQQTFNKEYARKKANGPVWAFNQPGYELPGVRRGQAKSSEEPTWAFNRPGYELPGVLSRRLREELDAKNREKELQEKVEAGRKKKPAGAKQK
ncbi:MAG: hypothetical protein V1731_00090 [Candidatus Aenigmatarchaeota archaeon]